MVLIIVILFHFWCYRYAHLDGQCLERSSKIDTLEYMEMY